MDAQEIRRLQTKIIELENHLILVSTKETYKKIQKLVELNIEIEAECNK